MANTYKDIVITPNKGSATDDPKIVFSGGNTTSNTDVTLRVYPDSNGTLSFEGSAGQLFSITNDLSGSLFTVNDVSGIPSIDVDALGNIDLAPFGGNVGIGTSNPVFKLDVQGDARITGNLTLGDATTDTITVNAANFNLANNVNFDSGTLFIDKSNDRIGIGTTSPAYKLDVNGLTRITGYAIGVDNTATIKYMFTNDGGASFVNSGNFGVGTSNPTAKLTINGGGIVGQGTGLFVANGDITSSRSGGSSGAYYFGTDSATKFLYHDGTNYYFGNTGNVITPQGYQAAVFYDTNSNYYIDADGGSKINNLQILGAVSASTNTAFYYDAALEVRELNLAGAQADIANCAPRIGMHWGGRVASQIVLESSGRIAIRNNPGNGYEAFAAGTTYIAGNLGIGAPPDTLLYIYKDNTVAHQNYIKIHMPGWAGSANYNKSIMWSDGSDVAGIGAYFDGTSVNFSFHSMYNAGYKTPANSVMNIMGTGNVGIGTTSTSARLQVTGASSSANVLYLNVGGNYLRASGFGSGNINLVGFENNVLIGNEYSVGDLALIAGGTERMRVTSAGLVGIGTGSPGAPLTVKANSSNYVLKLQSYDSPDYNLTVNFSDASNARINATQDLYITSGYRTFFTAVGGGWGSSHTFRTANPRTYSIPGSVIDSIRSDDTFAPTANNGAYQHLRLNSIINQTGSANGNYTGIYVNITETSAKGPTNRLIDLNIGETTKFNVANTGTTYIAGALGVGTSPSHALHVNGNAMVSGSIYNNDIRDTGGNAKLNWSVGAEYVINVHGPINNIGTHTMLAPTFSSAPRGSLVLGDGFAGDILAFKSPSTVELYDGTTWSSTTLTDAMRNLFQGKHATNYSTYTLSTAYAGIRFTYTSSDMAMYIFTNAFMISSMTQGNSCYAKMETSTDGGSTWTDYFTTASFNTWPGYTIYNHVANTNASTNRIRISIIRNGASNGNAVVLGQISLLESYQSFSNKLFNWNVNRWLGVGTVSNGPVTPQAPLDVAGAIVARSGAVTTAVASSSILDNNAGIARLISRGSDASTNGTFQLISTRSDGSSLGYRIAIDADGNVGIGTTTPGSKFVIANGTDGMSFHPASNIISLGFNRNAADGAIYNAANSAWQFTARDSYFALEGYNGVNTFATASGSIFTVSKANAFVGIGTTAPSQRLTVAGGQILVGPTDNGNSYINFYSTSYRVGASSGLEIQTGSGDVIRFLRGSTESARIDSTGNVGIGTTSPGARLEVAALNDATVNYPFIVRNQATTGSGGGSGTGIQFISHSGIDAGKIYAVNDVSGSTSMVFTNFIGEFMRGNGSSVCIGTTATATSKLRVVAGAGLTALSATGAGSASLIIDYLGAGDNYYDAGTHIFRSTSGTTERMRLDSSGRLGIGTTPDTFLHIYKNNTVAHQNYIKIHMPSWAGSAGYNKNIVWSDGTGDVAGIGAYFDGTSVNFSFHSMYNGGLKTNANSVMNIMGTGNVGIGTTTPVYRLHIQEDNGGARPQLYVTDTTAGYGLYVASGMAYQGTITNHSFGILVNNSERVRVDTSGNVGIGTFTATSKLEVNGGIKDSKGDVRDIPLNTQTSVYALSLSDTGKVVSTNANILVPNSVFTAGHTISVFNSSAATITISANSGVTFRLAGQSNSSNRLLSQNGVATIICVGANNFVISGAGLS